MPRMRRQKHFADRAEASIHRLQEHGAADPGIDPAIAAMALGSMIGRFAELWLVAHWAEYEFDTAVEQISRLWANAIGLEVPAKTALERKPAAKTSSTKKKPAASKK